MQNLGTVGLVLTILGVSRMILAAPDQSIDERLATLRPAIEERSVKANVLNAMPLVLKWGRLFDLSPSILMAMIDAESTFKPTAVSRAGAIGYGQHMPREIDAWLERLWKWADKGSDVYKAAKQTVKKWTGQAKSLHDADLNIMLLAWHMRFLVDMFGAIDTAILAYKAGETAMRRRIRTGVPLATREGEYYLAKIKYFEPTYSRALIRREVV